MASSSLQQEEILTSTPTNDNQPYRIPPHVLKQLIAIPEIKNLERPLLELFVALQRVRALEQQHQPFQFPPEFSAILDAVDLDMPLIFFAEANDPSWAKHLSAQERLTELTQVGAA